MFTPWNLGFVCLGGRNARINVECLNLVRQGGVIPMGFSHSLGSHPTKLHQLIRKVELFYFAPWGLVIRLGQSTFHCGKVPLGLVPQNESGLGYELLRFTSQMKI